MTPMGLAFAVLLTVAQADSGAPPPAPAADAPSASSSDAAQAWDHLNDEGEKIASDLKTRDLDGLKAIVPATQADVATFLAKYPDDKNAAPARLVQVQLGTLARELQAPGAPTVEQTQQQLTALEKDSRMPASIRAQATLMDVAQLMQKAQVSKEPAAFDEIDRRIDKFEKDFGDLSLNGQSPAVLSIRQAQIEIEKMTADKTHYHALLTKLTNDPHPEIAAMAVHAQADEKALADLKSKPMELQFTALDGAPVDLAKLRGKVVLIDFWATWSPLCRAETPDVVAVYQKYHDKGFEIIGICLDKEKDALQKYIADNKMPWPQYFDGQGWENAISARFGIQSLPAMWLVGKDGLLVTQDGHDDLDAQVARLLGTK